MCALYTARFLYEVGRARIYAVNTTDVLNLNTLLLTKCRFNSTPEAKLCDKEIRMFLLTSLDLKSIDSAPCIFVMLYLNGLKGLSSQIRMC
jgi:hypothetical protein